MNRECDWCHQPAVRSRETWGNLRAEYPGVIRWYACEGHVKQLESPIEKQRDPRPRKSALPPSEKLFDDSMLA